MSKCHDKSIATLSIMLSEIRFNQKRHRDRSWQNVRRDKLAIIYDEEIEALDYALGVLTGRIIFNGADGKS